MDPADDLPQEVLCKIFLYLDPKVWLLNISLVCHSWKNALNLVWRKVEQLEHLNSNCELTLSSGRKLLVKSKPLNHLVHNRKESNYLNFYHFIDNCSETLKSMNVFIPDLHPSWNREKKLSLVGAKCKNLKVLGLCGNLSPIIGNLAGACLNWSNLKRISISDRSIDYNADISMFVTEILATCQHLQFVDLTFYGGYPPADIFDALVDLKLTRFSCNLLSCLPIAAAYVESILLTITRCGSELKEVHLCGRIFDHLNNSLCRSFMTALKDEKKIESLTLGFELMVESNSGRYHKIFKAPWSSDIFNCLRGFSYLHELTLENFDFSNHQYILETLEQLAPQLTLLHLDKNYNLHSSFFEAWTVKLPKLKTFYIGDAQISDNCLSEFIGKCPSLTLLKIDASFMDDKNFLFSIYDYLHSSGDKKDTVCIEPLLINFICDGCFCEDEEDEWRTFQLCCIEIDRSRIKIQRICSKNSV